jgi:hypothetical protein
MEVPSSPVVRANSLQELSPIFNLASPDEDHSTDEDSDIHLKFLDLAGIDINKFLKSIFSSF